MKSVLLASSAALALVLTGCNATGMGHTSTNTTAHTHTHAQTHSHHGHNHAHGGYPQSPYPTPSYHTAAVQRFVCENDAQPVIRRISDNQIQLTVDETTTTMTAAPSGSGERYVSSKGVYGKGGEWQQKGNAAVFTYHGYGSPTNCHPAR